MWRLVPTLVREMGQAYPELARAEALIAETLKLEETRFRNTLERGLAILDEESRGLKHGDRLKGETAFTLYDTYGFPLDLTQDALKPRGIAVDTDGFNAPWSASARRRAPPGPGRATPRPRRCGSAAREARRDRVPRLRDRERRGRRGRAGEGRQGSRRAACGRERRGHRQPDAVLRRVRRPGRRQRAHARRRRALHRQPTPRRRRATCSSIPARWRRARSRSATPLALEVDHARRERHPADIIRRRISCTRRCARCSATTSRRRARWSRPTGCASTSRIPSR